MDMRTILLLGLGGLMLLAAAARAFSAPRHSARSAAVNMLLGLGSLVLVNATTALTGLSLGVNVFNAAVVSVLGVPGLVLLLLLQWAFT